MSSRSAFLFSAFFVYEPQNLTKKILMALKTADVNRWRESVLP